MNIPFYHTDDPFCQRHEPDDRQWGLDHFYRKLLLIFDGFHTKTAQSLATNRIVLMHAFLEQLGRELNCHPTCVSEDKGFWEIPGA